MGPIEVPGHHTRQPMIDRNRNDDMISPNNTWETSPNEVIPNAKKSKKKKKKPKQNSSNQNNYTHRNGNNQHPNASSSHGSPGSGWNGPPRSFGHQLPFSQGSVNNSVSRPTNNFQFIPRQVELMPDSVMVHKRPELDKRHFETGTLKKGIVTSVNKYELMIQLEEDAKLIDLLSERLGAYLSEYKVLIKFPKFGFLCCVLIDGKWLRAKITGHDRMELVDVGKLFYYRDRSGEVQHEIYFIDKWPELKRWPMLSSQISIESFSNGARKSLTYYLREKLTRELVGKSFIFELNSLTSGELSAKFITHQVLDPKSMMEYDLVTAIPELPMPECGDIVVTHVKKLKDGCYSGRIEKSNSLVHYLSRQMSDFYSEEKGLGINAITMQRGHYVVWRVKQRDLTLYKRVVITGESDDGIFYEGRVIDSGEVGNKLRVSETFKMVVPFNQYPAQSLRFTVASGNPVLPESVSSVRIYSNSKNEDGTFIVDRYDIIEPKNDAGEDVPRKQPDSIQHTEIDWPLAELEKDESKKDETGSIAESHASSSVDHPLSMILEGSMESYAIHESQFSQETLPSIADEFEPSFYEIDEKRNYPNDEMESFGDEITQMVANQDVAAALESILHQVVENQDRESQYPEMTRRNTLVDVDLPVASSDVLVDLGCIPSTTVDLMNLPCDESPCQRASCSMDILTGDLEITEPIDSVSLEANGDLIKC